MMGDGGPCSAAIATRPGRGDAAAGLKALLIDKPPEIEVADLADPEERKRRVGRGGNRLSKAEKRGGGARRPGGPEPRGAGRAKAIAFNGRRTRRAAPWAWTAGDLPASLWVPAPVTNGTVVHQKPDGSTRGSGTRAPRAPRSRANLEPSPLRRTGLSPRRTSRFHVKRSRSAILPTKMSKRYFIANIGRHDPPPRRRTGRPMARGAALTNSVRSARRTRADLVATARADVSCGLTYEQEWGLYPCHHLRTRRNSGHNVL